MIPTAEADIPKNFPLKVELLSSQVGDASLLKVIIQGEIKDFEKWKPENFYVLFNKKKFLFFKPELSGVLRYEAWVSVPYLYQPGKAEIQVYYEHQREKGTLPLNFQVTESTYPSEVLKVDPSKVTPPKSALGRIARENKEIGAIYKILTPKPLWGVSSMEKDFGFVLPIASEVTSPFGTKRLYNGKMEGFHKGLDLKAAIGTPVMTSGNGKVVLAKDLYFTGNTVIVDHGIGLFTLYCHMSKLDTKVGDLVKQGQVIGLAGMTGRASGPHLHWGAVLQGEKVKPLELLSSRDGATIAAQSND